MWRGGGPASAAAAVGRSARGAVCGRGLRRGVSASRALQQKVREQRRRAARTALLRTGLVGGARDVEVRPFEPLGELAEKSRGGNRAAVTPADIGKVGEVALQLLRVFLGQRQLPAAVVRAYPGLQQLAHQLLVASPYTAW